MTKYAVFKKEEAKDPNALPLFIADFATIALAWALCHEPFIYNWRPGEETLTIEPIEIV